MPGAYFRGGEENLRDYALSLEARLAAREEELRQVRRDAQLVIDGSLRNEMSREVKARLRRALLPDTEAAAEEGGANEVH